ncbi:MAG: hypothetical protein ACRDTD_21590 [Pseudonocardiaceae bacterium]
MLAAARDHATRAKPAPRSLAGTALTVMAEGEDTLVIATAMQGSGSREVRG